MHRPIFRDRIEARKKGLVRIVNASWKDFSLDVVKVDEEGKVLCRNLFIAPIGGYMVEFQDWGLQKWGTPKININNSFDYTFASEKDIETVVNMYPDFKWTLQKCGNLTNDEVMKALAIWKKHPKIELVLAAGFKKVAFNESFYRLNAQLQKKITKVMIDLRDCENAKWWTLAELKEIVKQQLSKEQAVELIDFNKFRRVKFSWNEMEFLKGHDTQFIKLYGDYKKMAKRAGHDFKDSYWYRPRNLKAMHDRVMEECRNLDALEFGHKNEKREKQYLKAVGKKNLAKVIEQKQWKVYIPESLEDIKLQADTLHQCLVSADYIQKVINKTCLLVFIRYKGKPMATAQIMKNGEIGQFYADERAKNIYPSARAKEMLQLWMNSFKKEAA